ncbi:MAG TPA: peptidylprolyl isomerase [Gaiellaceae bacterium]|nr:peptidylprolyl isomerase [Gaiellaceae bacterium]
MLRLALAVLLASAVVTGAAAAASPPPQLLHPSSLHAKAPAVYHVSFKTTRGTFVVTVHRVWAPAGADRFYNLVRARFFDGVTFFRVVKGFVVQFGISPYPTVSKVWQNADLKDDPVKLSNTPGTITYADAGPNTRTTQVFVNLGSNAGLDTQGFAPFGRVTSGMRVVDRLYGGYGEKPTNDQPQIAAKGNAFLHKTFPKLDSIVTARIAG